MRATGINNYFFIPCSGHTYFLWKCYADVNDQLLFCFESRVTKRSTPFINQFHFPILDLSIISFSSLFGIYIGHGLLKLEAVGILDLYDINMCLLSWGSL